MKTMKISMVLCTAVSLAANVAAQVFNSGSSGALGNVVISNNTVWAIPDNGQFHVNSLFIEPGATLSFTKPTNGLNPPVYILARSNVTIHGEISVDGQDGGPALISSESGPGGFNGGGAGLPPATIGGAGQGPGGGTNAVAVIGGGSFGTPGATAGSGPVYGNLLLIPLIGGSGGGGSLGSPNASGGGGGGAILIGSDTRIELSANGRIFARGGAGFSSFSEISGPGSGGGVRLVAPQIAGTGQIDVGGGSNPAGLGFEGGNGRARIDALPQPISISVIGHNGTPPWRVGRNPIIFPANAPRLDITHAAGRDIPPGTNSSVLVTLPTGSSSNQVVTLKATNFTGEFDVSIQTAPESGVSDKQSFRWNVGTNSMATTNVTVVIPGSIPTRITAWAEVGF